MFAIAICCTACDCLQIVSGVVVDAHDRKPLMDVSIGKKGSSPTYVTDSLGHFEFRSVSGGLFRCPPLQLVFQKLGVESRMVEFRNGGGDTIFLQIKNDIESP